MHTTDVSPPNRVEAILWAVLGTAKALIEENLGTMNTEKSKRERLNDWNREWFLHVRARVTERLNKKERETLLDDGLIWKHYIESFKLDWNERVIVCLLFCRHHNHNVNLTVTGKWWRGCKWSRERTYCEIIFFLLLFNFVFWKGEIGFALRSFVKEYFFPQRLHSFRWSKSDDHLTRHSFIIFFFPLLTILRWLLKIISTSLHAVKVIFAFFSFFFLFW